MDSTLRPIFLRTLPLLLFGVTLLGLLLKGPYVILGPVFVLIIHPSFDQLIKSKFGGDNKWSLGLMKLQIHLYPLLQTLLLIVGALAYQSSPDWREKLIIILACGLITGGLGITLAHECVHSSKKYLRALGIYRKSS